MNCEKWLKLNTQNLAGKTVAITGSTGGLGVELCSYIAKLSGNLILLNRNVDKTQQQISKLKREFEDIKIDFIPIDLANMHSVECAVDILNQNCPDFLIHNAGAYSIPRFKTDQGIDNVFQINFLAPYYMTRELLPELQKRNGRVIFVGSIAHNYSKIDLNDIDFSSKTAASLVYGNAKRYLMLSTFELFKNEKNVRFSIAHPGITFTNITNHYPKLIFAIIKHPMKVIFMKPKKAALSIIKGLFDECEYGYWIGPEFFDVWGMPSKKRLKTFTKSEAEKAFAVSENLMNRKVKNESEN